ncbi:MAG: hypothetical protein SOW20_05385 [Berryella intestinalis]|uniref:hypothetical protein n=1 Tax=Berryella intestinalis TaxID=1531429 RepID=UPI002A5359AA|nr:hypothetical protein [Berryella intestinalis]MDD7369908.1 hypothetical protein [Berryella intestinalis]MDY3129439.1 hypothetical protein [Berryella intestinalis]
MSKFAEGQYVTMAPDNSILLQIKLPYIEESGNYRSEVFSGYMNREAVLALNWSSMKQTSSTSERLKKLKDEAEKLEAGNYYGPTWKALREAMVKADNVLGLEDSSSDQIVPAIQQMERAFKALRADMENPSRRTARCSSTSTPRATSIRGAPSSARPSLKPMHPGYRSLP